MEGYEQEQPLSPWERQHQEEIKKVNEKNNALEGLVARLSDKLAEKHEETGVDYLTSLLNTRGFDQAVAKILAEKPAPEMERRTGKSEQPKICLIVRVDVDNFKGVNDTYGHDIGDVVLKETGNYLKSLVRESDPVGRIGGDEFMIFMPGGRAGSLRDKLNEGPMGINIEGLGKIEVTFSAGMKEFMRGEDYEEAKKAADDALYAVKKGGKNGVAIAGEEKEAAS